MISKHLRKVSNKVRTNTHMEAVNAMSEVTLLFLLLTTQ